MKNKIILALAIIFTAFISCTKENTTVNTPDVNGAQTLVLNASLEGENGITRTSMDSQGNVNWGKDDFIYMFNDENTQFKSGTSLQVEGKYTGEFVFENWKGTPTYAVLNPHTTYASASISGDVITTNLITSQRINKKGSFGNVANLSVGKVESDGNGGYSTALKNVCGLIGCEVDEGVSTITLTANEDIAGKITIDYNDGNPKYTIVEGEKEITLNYLDGSKAGTFYFCVLPQTISGFTITAKDADGNVLASKTGTNPLTVGRNQVVNLGKLYTIPETFQLDIPATAFAEVDAFPKGTTGSVKDVATYSLTIDGVAYTLEFFGGPEAVAGTNGYHYKKNAQVLSLGHVNGYMKLPKLEGKVLQSVEITITTSKAYGVTDTPETETTDAPTWAAGGNQVTIAEDNPHKWRLTSPDASKDYYLVGRTGSTFIKNITLIYKIVSE